MNAGLESRTPDPRVGMLSRLELEIWNAKLRGISNLEVAARLFLYEGDVRRHLRVISKKLRAAPPVHPLLNGRSEALSR